MRDITDVLNCYSEFQLISNNGNSRVYVATYVPLNEKRVIKVIKKGTRLEQNVNDEIFSLKSTRHPNIPSIYDCFEDEKDRYIVMDYIQGPTLKEYLSNEVYEEQELIFILIRLCDILEYLHNHEPEPLVYLDIHPKNIIIKNKEPFLVDFGNGGTIKSINEREYSFGTRGFAAPEQEKGAYQGKQTDIYSMGALMIYMLSMSEGVCLHKDMWRSIGETAMGYEMTHRYEKIEELSNDLKKLLPDKVLEKEEKGPLIISVSGADKGVGTTHIAILIQNSLAKRNIKACYIDVKGDFLKNLINISDECKLYMDHYEYMGSYMKLEANENEAFTDFQVVVRDCGSYDSKGVYEGINILVVGGKPWMITKNKDINDYMKKNNVKVIYNLTDEECYSLVCSYWKRAGYKVGYCDPFKSEEVLKELVDDIVRNLPVT